MFTNLAFGQEYLSITKEKSHKNGKLIIIWLTGIVYVFFCSGSEASCRKLLKTPCKLGRKNRL